MATGAPPVLSALPVAGGCALGAAGLAACSFAGWAAFLGAALAAFGSARGGCADLSDAPVFGAAAAGAGVGRVAGGSLMLAIRISEEKRCWRASDTSAC